MTILPSLGGPQETTLLRLDLVNGWLFTIDQSRVKDEATRQRILTYKRECYQVLFDHFHGLRKTAHESFTDPQPNLQASIETRLALDMVSEARRMYGPARGRLLWDQLGLPAVPPLPDPMPENPRLVLETLLNHETGKGTVRELIAGNAMPDMREMGLIIDESGLFIANSHPVMLTILQAHPRHWRTLARLPGAVVLAAKKFGLQSHRAVFLPYSAILQH